MKKRFLAIALCICVLTGVIMTASGSGSADNVLISKSYLEGTYLQEMQSYVIQCVNDAITALTAGYKDRVAETAQGYLDKLPAIEESETKWLSASDYVAQIGEYDDRIFLATGAGLILTSGAVRLDSGTVIDLTEGKEVSAGNLMAGHRYIAAGETAVTVVSSVAQWSVEGEWQTTSDGKVNPVNLFTDISKDDWYYDAVCYVVERGLFQGTSDTTFAPSVAMNRAMLATVIYRMRGTPETTYSAIFTDVPDGQWYSLGIVWAASNGIVKGVGNDAYQPMGDLSREQIALMLYNYANWLGLDTTGRADLSQHPDGDTVSAWATEGMSWAVSVGLFQGDGNKNLNPRDPATRYAVATLLQRFELLVN